MTDDEAMLYAASEHPWNEAAYHEARERLAGLLDRNRSLVRLWHGVSADGSSSMAAAIARAHIQHGVRYGKSDEEILVVTLCAVADHADDLMKRILRLLARLRALEEVALAAEALASAEDRYEVLCGEEHDGGGLAPCVLIEAGNAYDDAHKGLRAALAAAKEGA